MEKRLVRVANAVLELEPREQYVSSVDANPEPELLKLDANESTLGPSPAVYEAIESFLHNWPLNWSPSSESDRLQDALAGYVSLPREAICSFADSQAAQDSIARTYLEPGMEVVISGPAEDGFEHAARATGARVIEVRHESPTDPQIEALIAHVGPRTRMIYIQNPSGLSGMMFNEAEIVFLLAYAEGCMVVVDEEYFEYCGHSVADLVLRFPNLIVKRSFARAFALGVEPISYIITDPDNMEFINRLRNSGNPSVLGMVAATASLEDINYMRSNMAAINQSKKRLAENLPEIGYEFLITPANFLLIKVPDPEMARRLLADEGIFVHAISDCIALSSHLRITIGTPEQTERLLLSLGKAAEKLATGFNRNRQENVINGPAARLRELAGIG